MTEAGSRSLAGPILMTMGTLVYGVIPLLFDFGDSHVANTDWVPHARMHAVWLLGVMSSLAVVALYFLWIFKADRILGVQIAGVIGLSVYGGFFASAGLTPAYGGALGDGSEESFVLGINGNLLAFSLATALLLLGWFLAAADRR